MSSILRESPLFQQILQEGREEGREEALEKGREKWREEGWEGGKLEGLRQTLLALVQARFPVARMKRLAKGQVAIIDDPAVLQELIVKVSMAQTAEEAQTILLDWPASDNEQD